MSHFVGQLGLRYQKQLVWEDQGICQRLWQSSRYSSFWGLVLIDGVVHVFVVVIDDSSIQCVVLHDIFPDLWM
jgi:hypothetical protein